MPIALFMIMVGMGLSLRISDFGQVTKFPKAILIGTFNQLVLLPIAAFCIIKLLGVTGLLAAGIMLISSCPGGPATNLISFVSRGNVALSVSLTAVNGVLGVITIPLITSFGLYYFLGNEMRINLPLWDTVFRVIMLTILPIGIGMCIHYSGIKLPRNTEKYIKLGAGISLFAILIGILISQFDLIYNSIYQLGPASLILNLFTMLSGWYIAKWFSLPKADRITISVESGIQNGGLAIVIASSIIGIEELSLVAGIYSVFMFITGGIFMYHFGYSNKKTT